MCGIPIDNDDRVVICVDFISPRGIRPKVDKFHDFCMMMDSVTRAFDEAFTDCQLSSVAEHGLSVPTTHVLLDGFTNYSQKL